MSDSLANQHSVKRIAMQIRQVAQLKNRFFVQSQIVYKMLIALLPDKNLGGDRKWQFS